MKNRKSARRIAAVVGAAGVIAMATAPSAMALDATVGYTPGWGLMDKDTKGPQMDGWAFGIGAVTEAAGVTVADVHNPITPGVAGKRNSTDHNLVDIKVPNPATSNPLLEAGSLVIETHRDVSKGSTGGSGSLAGVKAYLNDDLRLVADTFDYGIEATPGKDFNKTQANLAGVHLEAKTLGVWTKVFGSEISTPGAGIDLIVAKIGTDRVHYTDENGKDQAAKSENGYYNLFEVSALGGVAGEITLGHGGAIVGEPEAPGIPLVAPAIGAGVVAVGALGAAGVYMRRRQGGQTA